MLLCVISLFLLFIFSVFEPEESIEPAMNFDMNTYIQQGYLFLLSLYMIDNNVPRINI